MWLVAEAKNRFSEFLSKSETEGPQRVTRRGRTFVLLTEADYERLAGVSKPGFVRRSSA